MQQVSCVQGQPYMMTKSWYDRNLTSKSSCRVFMLMRWAAVNEAHWLCGWLRQGTPGGKQGYPMWLLSPWRRTYIFTIKLFSTCFCMSSMSPCHCIKTGIDFMITDNTALRSELSRHRESLLHSKHENFRRAIEVSSFGDVALYSVSHTGA